MRRSRSAVAGICALLLATLSGCGGGGGSDVGDQTNAAPIARITLIGVGANNVVREGEEVTLSGKESDGVDDPISTFTFSQTGTPSVQLRELSSNSKVFTAPRVAAGTSLAFRLDVVDASGGTASTTTSINVVPARDSDKFLQLDADTFPQSDDSLDTFVVRVTPTNSSAATFSINIGANLIYPDRGNPPTIRNLQLGADGPFPNPIQAQFDGINPVDIRLRVPRVVISVLNQMMLNRGLPRAQLLDPWKADEATIELTVSLSLGANDAAGFTVLPPGNGNPIGVGDENTPLVVTSDEILNGGMGLVESKASAEAYYAALDDSTDLEASTLNHWLTSRGFADAKLDAQGAPLVPLQVVLKEQAIKGQEEFAHAIYTNNFDLGFGRDMYLRTDDAGNVFSFVKNHPSLETAMKGIANFVTVVMEYSPPVADPTAAKFVRFYVYTPDETGDEIRVKGIDFDGRGQRYVPGVCAACHGGTPASTYPNGADIAAAFMPWDLDSFLFAGKDDGAQRDPSLPDPNAPQTSQQEKQNQIDFTRANQEDQFRKLNQAVYHTYLHAKAQSAPSVAHRFDPAIALMEGWYTPAACGSGVALDGCLKAKVPTDPQLPGCHVPVQSGETCFDGTHVPDGWNDAINDPIAADSKNLYLDVFARHCRACHTLLNRPDAQGAPSPFLFSKALDFQNSKADIATMVFQKGTMPMARLTMDRLWAGFDGNPPVEKLREYLTKLGITPSARPGIPVPVPTIETRDFGTVVGVKDVNGQALSYLTKVGRSTGFNADSSLFADSFAWSLAPVTSTVPVGTDTFDCEVTDGSAIESPSASRTLLQTTADGNYCVQLTATNDTGSVTSTPIPLRARLNQAPQVSVLSTCQGTSACVMTSEFNTGGQTSVVRINASETQDPGTLFQVTDADLTDLLDRPSDIAVTFQPQQLTYGVITGGPTTLAALQGAPSPVTYSANSTVAPLSSALETVGFSITDDSTVYGPFAAKLRVVAVNDNSPVVSSLSAFSVGFGLTSAVQTFTVTDADNSAVDIVIASAKGTVSPPNPATAINTLSGAAVTYTLSVPTARVLAGNQSLCSAAGQFAAGRNQTTISVTPDDQGPAVAPTTAQATFTRGSYSYANAVSFLSGATAASGACSTCHTASSPTFLVDYGDLTANVVFTGNPYNPIASSIYADTNHATQPHTGGAYTLVGQAGETAFREWIYQCAAQ